MHLEEIRGSICWRKDKKEARGYVNCRYNERK